MNKLTGKEIIKKLEKSGITVDEFAFEDYDPQTLELGDIKEIEQVGGEGEGDHWHSVKFFKDHDVYLKVTGWYTSHNGTDFESWKSSVKEVKPKEKTITIYE